MKITANNPNRKSWLQVDRDSDFPIQNIPFGVFLTKEDVVTIGTRIGDYAIDLAALQQLGYFEGIPLTDDIFMQDSLNDFITDGQTTWRLVRNRIAAIFDLENKKLKEHKKHRNIAIFKIDEIEMLLPVEIGDYTDFYSSKDHATNVGTMFRDPENALLPNWLHIPVGYHGRASSIVVSGTKVRRPLGQTMPQGATQPVFGPSKLLDFEVEMGFITAEANELGKAIDISEAKDHIFGMVLLNDWSARDIQKWEYVPLGPFLAKNFASTISPWIVTLDALEPFKAAGPEQDPQPLPYLIEHGEQSYDIQIETSIKPRKKKETLVSTTNFKNLYWSISQQLAHQSVNGCNVRSGDLYGSGTISGKEKSSYGSMLELTWKGTEPIKMSDGTERKFIQDGDTVIMRAHCKNDAIRIGFGECIGRIKKARKYPKE
ncbi:fumarylacetoacetase [Lutimonas sp.]|uniref:fumarylacetoacetase n=1 Tax=Lutimonas sp. TaxID=1872403 RepID=UPI003D9BD435